MPLSKTGSTQSRHIGRPRPRRGPMKATVLLRNRDVVDARFAATHQPVLVELPLLVAVGAIPLAGVVMPFVLKAHRDAVVVEPKRSLIRRYSCFSTIYG